MEAKATAKFIRCTPRKINSVIALVRNKQVEKALEILSFLPKSAAIFVEKVLKSAVANMGEVENHAVFRVKEIWVGNGPILKRMRPGSMGKSMPIKKRTSHITVVVTDMESSKEKRERREL
jgi:large subunit ribosomal protein L22